MQKQITSLDGIKINYEVHGATDADRCLVFLHGLGGCLRAFDHMIANLADTNQRLISIDLRAHGLSQRPAHHSQHALHCFTDDLFLILQAEKVQRPTLVGHCFGGIVAMNAAINYPQLVGGLILINVSYKVPHLSKLIYQAFPLKGVLEPVQQVAFYCKSVYFGKKGRIFSSSGIHHYRQKLHPFLLELTAFRGERDLLNRLLAFMLKFLPHLYFKNYPDYAKFEQSGDFNPKRIGSDVLHTSFKSYVYMCREIMRFDFSKRLKDITCPTLVIHGAQDRVFSAQVARSLARKIKGARLRIIKRGNHLTILNNKEELVAIIKQHLAV